MPLPMPHGLKARLVQQVAAELAHATVFADKFVSAWSLRGISNITSLPERGELADLLYRYIGDDPLTTFIASELDRGFRGPGINMNLVENPLTDYEGYTDLNTVSSQLIDSLTTLPWQYQLTVALPSAMLAAIPAGQDSYGLSPRHRIISGARLEAEFPVQAQPQGLAAFMLRSNEVPPWQPEGAYLQIAMSGYVPDTRTEPFLAARDEILAFCGLGIAVGLFNEYATFGNRNNSKATHFYIHRQDEGAWHELSTPEIASNYQAGIQSLSVSYSAVDAAVSISAALEKIATVFKSPSGNRIALSARWLFESQCGTDALLQYVQAAVAIEVLLGDEKADPSIGLTALMANRFGYSLAKTPADREELVTLFRDIYNVRSKIVHRGKNRLNVAERQLFSKLKTVLQMVIRNELKLLERAERLAARKDRAD